MDAAAATEEPGLEVVACIWGPRRHMPPDRSERAERSSHVLSQVGSLICSRSLPNDRRSTHLCKLDHPCSEFLGAAAAVEAETVEEVVQAVGATVTGDLAVGATVVSAEAQAARAMVEAVRESNQAVGRACILG